MKDSEQTIIPNSSSELHQELIFNNSVDLTFLLGVEKDGRYRFITVNTAFLNAARLTKEQVEGKYAEEVIPPDLYPRIRKKYEQAIREKQTVQWEDDSEYPDGRRRIGVITITPVFNEQDVCTLLVGTLHDITERKKAEEELKSRENQLDLIYNTVSDIIFLLSIEPGPRYRFTSVNNAFLGATGLTNEMVEGRYVHETIPEPSLSFVLANYAKAVTERRKVQWEETTEYPAGSKTGIVTISPVFNDEGECHMLVGAVHDITERKKVSEEKDRVAYLLNERIKELTTLYRADQILKSEEKPVDILMQELVAILPPGWQYPDITEARIILDDQQYTTKGYTAAVSSQSADFSTPDGKKGSIEVLYTKETPAEDEGPFLKEERNLINMLAEKLRLYFDRKEASEHLRKEKELSDRIIETLPGLFYMIDPTGRYIKWNKRKETISGYTHEEMSNMVSLDFFYGDDKKKILEAIQYGFKTGSTEVEANVVTKDNRKILHLFNGVVIDYEGKPCLMGTGIDITERKKAEEQVKKEKELSDQIIETLPGIFYLFDEEGHYLRWNKNFETVTGYSAEEMSKIHPLKFVADEEKQMIEQRIGIAFTEGYADAEIGFMTKDGRKIPYFVNGISVTYEGKKCLMGVGIDITERRKVEEKNRKSEERFRVLVDSAPDATVIVDEKGLIQMVNKQTETILGYRREELIGQPVEVLIPSELHTKHAGYRESYQKEEKRREMGMGMELFAVKKDGTKLPVEISLAPFHSDEGTQVIASIRDITERKKAEELIKKEKELSDRIIETLPGIFYLFDETGQYLRWNKNHETVPGYTTEEMKQMHPLKFFETEEEKQLIAERIGRVFTEGYAEVEAEFLAKDGRKIPHYFNGVSINFEGKNCLMGVGIDITERKKMETEIREAEIKFRTLAEKSMVGVYIVQRGKFVYVNPRFSEIFGYEDGEIVQIENVIDTIATPEYRDVIRENVRARLQGEIETIHYEIKGLCKDGTQNWVEFFGSRTIYGGQPSIIGTMIDITERKSAEEALKKSEANLHTVFDTTDTIYLLLDTDFKVISFNQRATHFFKNELGKDLQLNSDIISYFPNDRRINIDARMRKVVKGETTHYESSYPQPDGSYHWYYVRMFPIRDNTNKVFGLMLAVSDISEKKLLEQQILNQRVEEQKRITRAVLHTQEKERNIIGQELHDNVNQILAGAKMFLGLTRKGGEDNAELIQKSIGLIDNAVNEIRALTRDQVTPQKKIDLKDLIQSLVDKLNEHADVKTTFKYNVGKAVINDDLKINIYRIVQEGINNILKHASAKSAVITVKAERKKLYVSIVDDGKGLDTTQKYKGVGLNNILNRVDSYNGSIAIDSGPKKGCRIELAIPL